MLLDFYFEGETCEVVGIKLQMIKSMYLFIWFVVVSAYETNISDDLMILQFCVACFSSSTLVQYKACPVQPVWFSGMKPECDLMSMSILAKVGKSSLEVFEGEAKDVWL